MNSVAQITPYLRNVQAPAAIRDLPAWVIWRLEHDPQVEKPRKVPYYANGGRRHGKQGGPSDVGSLVTFDAAKRAAARRGFDGVGIATLPQFGICALDFDDCIVDGQIDPAIAPLLCDTYAEYSPSGKGIRVLFQGDLGNNKDHKTASNRFGFETFSTRGFVTFTGNTLDITEVMGNEDVVAPLTQRATDLFATRFGRRDEADSDPQSTPPMGISAAKIDEMLRRLDPDMGHDEWLHVGMGLHHETHGEGFSLWDRWSAQSEKYPGVDTLRMRWRSFETGAGRVVTIRTALRMAGINLHSPASAEEFESIVAQGEPESATPRFVFEPVHTFSSTQALPWIVKGVLPKASLGVVYGASGSGKSFVVLDMGMAVARGAEWRGRKVRQGRVAYIAAEGADGFRKRIAAYAQHNAIDLADVPMTVLNAAPNLLEEKDAADVARGVKTSGGADLIIVDTFAQTTPGANENAGEDVGRALGYCKRIHEVTGAMVLLIHHSGKDSTKGARGWSGLRAACDAEIEVCRGDTGRSLRLTKSKDGEDGLEWGFDLEVVQLGVDEDLDPITSCVVIEAAVPAAGGASGRKMGKNERVVHEVIQEFAQAQSEGIEIEPVISEAVRRMKERDGVTEDKRGNYRTMARKALNKICGDDDDSPYWLNPASGAIDVC